MTGSLTVSTVGGSYPVLIGDGLIDDLGRVLGEVLTGVEVVALVSDVAVDALHGDRARAALSGSGRRIETFALPTGEASKSPATLTALWRWMAAIGMHRGDLVVALGGGVVGDVAGFAAATYHRGVDVVQIPTTLLSQVDASIGGKTAVDLPEGKNLVGAFHQPRAVVADVGALATLPGAAFATGLAEVIKHGLIAPVDLLAKLERDRDAIEARDPDVLISLVRDAAAVKIEVVSEDEKEHGRRAHLNYGHTLAHAIEALSAYEGITHGEAVAIGLVFVAEVAAALGYEDLRGLHRTSLTAAGLPTGGAGHPYEVVAKAWERDKKYDGGVRFVLLKSFGHPIVVGDIDEDVLRAAYEVVR